MARLETLFVGASPSARSMRASPEYRLAMLHVLGLRAVGHRHRAAGRDRHPMTSDTRIEFTVNGRARSIEVAPHHTLLEVLRDDLGLTGTKECCLVGECGACTVLVDGRSVDSCLMLAVEADGASVTTVEGLATGDRLHPLQQAFLDTGAAQCGFCIPGQLISAQALLALNPHPTRAEVEEGLAGQPLPVRGLRADHRGRPGRGRGDRRRRDRAMIDERVGASPARVGGLDRVTGRQVYVADVRLDDVAPRQARHHRLRPRPDRRHRHQRSARGPRRPPGDHRRRSPAADATLRAAVRGPAGPRGRRDALSRRAGRGDRGRDPRRGRGRGAPRPGRVRGAAGRLHDRCRARPGRAARPGLRRSGPDDPLAATNVLREHRYGWGDVEAAARDADVVVEGTYTFPMVTQFAIEPHGFIAAPDGDGIAIWSSIQHPSWLQRVIAGAARTCRWRRCGSSRPTRAAGSVASSTPSTSRCSRSWPSGPVARSASC